MQCFCTHPYIIVIMSTAGFSLKKCARQIILFKSSGETRQLHWQLADRSRNYDTKSSGLAFLFLYMYKILFLLLLPFLDCDNTPFLKTAKRHIPDSGTKARKWILESYFHRQGLGDQVWHCVGVQDMIRRTITHSDDYSSRVLLNFASIYYGKTLFDHKLFTKCLQLHLLQSQECRKKYLIKPINLLNFHNLVKQGLLKIHIYLTAKQSDTVTNTT